MTCVQLVRIVLFEIMKEATTSSSLKVPLLVLKMTGAWYCHGLGNIPYEIYSFVMFMLIAFIPTTTMILAVLMVWGDITLVTKGIFNFAICICVILASFCSLIKIFNNLFGYILLSRGHNMCVVYKAVELEVF